MSERWTFNFKEEHGKEAADEGDGRHGTRLMQPVSGTPIHDI
jgi:hypothetical protein